MWLVAIILDTADLDKATKLIGYTVKKFVTYLVFL